MEVECIQPSTILFLADVEGEATTLKRLQALDTIQSAQAMALRLVEAVLLVVGAAEVLEGLGALGALAVTSFRLADSNEPF